ncbi:MAG: hypothetical protein GEEBNDBF_01785 [bacterium]|nr:hypothetical protein [bacterium]
MRILSLALLLPGLFLLSCQRSATPVAPAAQEQSAAPTLAQDPATGPLFAADLMIDLTTNHAELTPVRQSAAIGDDYSELGLTPAFTKTFGNNFRVVAVRRPAPGTIEVDVQITHPFSPASRPDLGIFNVKCFVVTDRTPANLSGVSIAPGVLANVDGYSNTWLATHPGSQPEFTAAPVQPYVILREDPSSAPFSYQSPAGFNVLFPGQTSIDTLALTLTTGNTFQARLYLTADYGQSAVRATRQTPQYDLPKFAGNAAWKVAVTELANDLQAGQPASTAQYQVDIWDWKHGQGLGSDVASATLQVPGVTSAPVTLSLSGTGSDPTPLTASTLITNGASSSEGDYWGLVTVTDSNQGVGLEENLTTPVSFGSYVTYQVFPVAVEVVGVPPTAAITRCIGGDLGTGIGETFDASGSTPGTNAITSYEWDWDYDGSNFTVDAMGITATHPFSAAGTPTVALRVSDGTPTGWDIATTIMAINPTASWRTPMRVTNNSFWDQFGDYSEIGNGMVTDSNNVVHIVYYDYGSVAPLYDFTMYYQSLDPCTSTWTAAQQIHTIGNQLWVPISLAIGPDDRLHVTGTYNGTEQGWMARETNGTWSAMVPITTNVGPGYWSTPNLAVNGSGQLGFALLRELPSASGGGPTDGIPEPPSPIYFTRYVSGSWTALQQIGAMDHKLNHSQGSVPSLTLEGTSGSDWVAAWSNLKNPFLGAGTVSSSSNVMWARTNSGTWQAPASLYTALSLHDRPHLRRAPSGTLFMGVETSAQVRLATYDGAAWSPTLTLIHSVSGSGHFQIAFDQATGAGMLVTSSVASTGQVVRAKRFLQTDTPAAIAASPDLTVLAAGTGRRFFPQVGSLGHGRWVTLWEGETYGAWQSGMELESSFWQ